ncbi:MAG: hypothetical protein AAGH83_11350 [Pseudomonadota bacterium]
MLIWFGAALALAACSDIAPSLPMVGAAQDTVVVGGQRYLVHHTGERAEATRLSRDPAPGTLDNIARAAEAIRQVTGCTIRAGTLYGDTVMTEAQLKCDDAPPSTLVPDYRYLPASSGRASQRLQ